MKVKVRLPGDYGRAFAGKDRFVKSEPVFDIEAYDDRGNRVQDPYPAKVRMGPDMYELLSYIMPSLAARRGEDLTYEGKVEQKPRKTKAKYAYYGLGRNPETGLDNDGIGLIGYGDTDIPNISKFGYLNGTPNYMYSRLLAAPSPLGSNSRSQVLTNILNDSWDFNPLLGPLYEYTDLDYDEAADLEGKGPKPTDNWVPRVDPVNGGFMRREDGSVVFMPIPLVQNLPIYNLKHPAWREAAVKGWNLVNDPVSYMDWASWGKAPSYADYTGRTSKTDKEEKLRELDYLLYNMKLAETPGYFESYPEFASKFSGDVGTHHEYDDFINQGLEKFDDSNEEDRKKKQQIIDERKKQVAEKIAAARRDALHEKVRDIKGQRSVEKIAAAREDATKELEKEHAEKMDKKAAEDLKNYSKTHLRPEEQIKTSVKNMKNFYRALVGKAFMPDSAKLLETRGITPEEKNDVIKFAKNQGFEKYNKIPDNETKMIYILDDYAKNKQDNDTFSNIVAGVKEPF